MDMSSVYAVCQTGSQSSGWFLRFFVILGSDFNYPRVTNPHRCRRSNSSYMPVLFWGLSEERIQIIQHEAWHIIGAQYKGGIFIILLQTQCYHGGSSFTLIWGRACRGLRKQVHPRVSSQSSSYSLTYFPGLMVQLPPSQCPTWIKFTSCLQSSCSLLFLYENQHSVCQE